MKIFDKAKSLLNKKDAAEWDANDPAGDESLYDIAAIEDAPYDATQFVEEK